jgi:hypothetical protein
MPVNLKGIARMSRRQSRTFSTRDTSPWTLRPGHFALDTKANEIAGLVKKFMDEQK